jgi:hypothetical protein
VGLSPVPSEVAGGVEHRLENKDPKGSTFLSNYESTRAVDLGKRVSGGKLHDREGDNLD